MSYSNVGELLVILTCFLFVTYTFSGVKGQDICKDKLTNCADYDKDVCESFPDWSKENCCRMCTLLDPCLPGWTHYPGDDTCLRAFNLDGANVQEYRIFKDANRKCNSFAPSGGSLVMIRDEKKNSFVIDLIGNSLPHFCSWIGLYNADRGKGFEFRYVDETPMGSYHPWLQGNPDNTNGREKCVCMYVSGDLAEPRWNDYNCQAVQSYVCQIPTK